MGLGLLAMALSLSYFSNLSFSFFFRKTWGIMVVGDPMSPTFDFFDFLIFFLFF